MASWVIAILVGIGGGAWVWNKSMKETSRQDTSAILAIMTVVIIFIVLFTFFKFILGF